jgi:hypothetical protein
MNAIDDRAAEIRARAARCHLRVTASKEGIITVSGNFKPGDRTAYVAMESNAHDILRMFRQIRAGSVWGTDSGSAGGAVGLEKGKFVLNKSGVEKRLAARFA